jgi:hypothetical protein
MSARSEDDPERELTVAHGLALPLGQVTYQL